MTAWSMLARLALKETFVPSGRTSSRMSSDPRVWIVEPVLAGWSRELAAGGKLEADGDPLEREARQECFACPAEPARSTAAPALASRLWRSPSSLAR